MLIQIDTVVKQPIQSKLNADAIRFLQQVNAKKARKLAKTKIDEENFHNF